MIPYDDLVGALTAWRARQGLPVAQAGVAASPPGRGRSPAATPPSPPRAAPPPPASAGLGDFDAGALIEDASGDASDDYLMQLDGLETETTASGAPSGTTSSARRGKRPDGW